MNSEQAALIGMILMPFTYGFIGWLTNVVALRMTFYPLKFVGIPPFLGWQGIVPRRATGLAIKALNMITRHLINIEDFFKRVNPNDLRDQFAPILEEDVPRVTRSMIEGLEPDVRAKITPEQEREIAGKAREHSLEKLEEITGHLSESVAKVFNMKTLVLRNLTGSNVHRIVDIFLAVGRGEFKFIERSGLYFGGLFGLVQMGLWALFPAVWFLPIMGVIVGYLTNWLALQMIFRPLKEKKFGPVRYQGLFLKRQKEVAQLYSGMFATHVLSARNIMEEILYKRISRAACLVAERDIEEVVLRGVEEERARQDLKRLVVRETSRSRSKAEKEMIERFAESSARIEKIMDKRMNVQKSMAGRMEQLPPEEFEPILRSAFQEDEWILILIGSVLGALVGVGQAVYMFLSA